jgi:hypothetical protein
VDAADPGAPDPLRPALIAFQEGLGRVQDLAVLRDAIRRVAGRLERAGLADGAAALEPVVGQLEAERTRVVEDFMQAVHAAGLDAAPVLSLHAGRRAAGG